MTSGMCLEGGIGWNSLMNWVFRAEDAVRENDPARAREMVKAARQSAVRMKEYFPPSRPIASEVSRRLGALSDRLTKEKKVAAGIEDELREVRFKALDIYREAKKACGNGEKKRGK